MRIFSLPTYTVTNRCLREEEVVYLLQVLQFQLPLHHLLPYSSLFYDPFSLSKHSG